MGKGLEAAINLYAVVCVGLLLSGCGESVSEYHQNEKRDETVDQRLKDIDARVSIVEEQLRARREEETK